MAFDLTTKEGVLEWLNAWHNDFARDWESASNDVDKSKARSRIEFIRSLKDNIDDYFSADDSNQLAQRLQERLIAYEASAYTNAEFYGEDSMPVQINRALATIVKTMYRQALFGK